MKAKYYILISFILCLAVSPLLIFKNKSAGEKNTSTSITPITQVVRSPAVAGSFYPADKDQLNKQLGEYISNASFSTESGKIRILIVPHAGIDYSGQVAGWGFKQLEGKSYSKIIILGVSHQTAFPYISVFSRGRWKTPLGSVDVDENLAANLVDKNNGIYDDAKVQSSEHSLEVELIYLQKVLKNFKVVPVLIGQVDDKILTSLSDKISQEFDEDTLLVVSSDLSHYPDWETANIIDNQTISAILSGNSDEFEKTVTAIESKSYPQVVTPACGRQAIKVALKVTQSLKFTDLRKIEYQNSGDVTKDKSRVVGYAAIGIWSAQLENRSVTLDEKAKIEAIKIATDTLQSYVNYHEKSEFDIKSKILKEPLGAFVTLKKNNQLRGCIGSFEPKEPLSNVIQNMTIAAASQDLRFQPVTPDELKDITIEISVMTPKKKISKWQDVVLGKNGVVVQKGFNSGTFLPQVATDTKWTLEEFLSELCSQKAGLARDCYKDPSVNLYTYEAQVFN
jgi:AmmeMemoRadiSam system protein B/AmmeMemoRadiSam system protein A